MTDFTEKRKIKSYGIVIHYLCPRMGVRCVYELMLVNMQIKKIPSFQFTFI